MNTIDQLRQRLTELSERMQAIQAIADKDNRAITAEEELEISNAAREFEDTEAELTRRLRIQDLSDRAGRPQGRVTQPTQLPPYEEQHQPSFAAQRASSAAQGASSAGDGLRNTRLPDAQERGRWGFAHVGEFYGAVRRAYVQNQFDPRLVRNAATTFGSEGIGEDGGFAVPPDWRSEIMELLGGEDSLLPRTDQQQTSSNQMVFAVDEKAPWHSSGVRGYWIEEANAATQTKPLVKQLTVRANKLGALVYMTDEMITDAPGLGRYVTSKAPIAMDWEITDAIINGSGVGKPLGIMNAPALVTVSKETSQPAGTILAANIYKMWSRMLAPRSRKQAVWLINQDIEPQLMQLAIPVKNVAGTENVGGMPVYIPPGGLSASPYASLLGRPVIPTEACATVGTTGDIILADLNGYLTVTKQSGIRSDISIHVEFERDILAFRFIFRIGGQPWLSAPVARRNGSNTLSTFVALETR